MDSNVDAFLKSTKPLQKLITQISLFLPIIYLYTQYVPSSYIFAKI